MNEKAPDDDAPPAGSAPAAMTPELAAELNAAFGRALHLHQAGRLHAAWVCYEQVRAFLPDDPGLLSNLGALHLDRGDGAQSTQFLQRSLTLDPNQPGAWNNLGNAFQRAGMAAEALQSYANAVQLAPDFADAWNNRGIVQKELGRPADALLDYRRALDVRPDFAEAWYNRGDACAALKNDPDALASYDRAIALKPAFPEAHNNRGLVLQHLDRHAEAADSFIRAIVLRPAYAEAHNNLGVLYSEQGRLAEAGAAFESAIRVRPDYAEAHHNLSTVRKYAPGDPHLLQLEAMPLADLPEADRIRLLFALGKAREDVGRYDDAFAAYAEGKRLLHARHPYDEVVAEGRVVEVMRVFDLDFFAARTPGPADDTCIPVFIVGMLRSGTTLLEQVLSTLPEVHGAGEIDDFNRAVEAAIQADGYEHFTDWAAVAAPERLAALGADYLARIRRLAPTARYIVHKMPDNCFFLGLIHLALPNARIVHAMRDPMDSCLSCFTKLFSDRLDFANDLARWDATTCVT
jgi:tetratricopeptide (TPR) repeat protein